jgi:hypothetical protein
MPVGAFPRSPWRGLLFLFVLVLAVLPVLAGEHHAATHNDHAGFEHSHAIDLEPCTQDHAVDGECAAISSCPVCVIRDHDAGARVGVENPGSIIRLTRPERGQNPAPDIHPPRPSVAG